MEAFTRVYLVGLTVKPMVAPPVWFALESDWLRALVPAAKRFSIGLNVVRLSSAKTK